MVRALSRAALTLMLCTSLVAMAWTLRDLIRNPAIAAMTTRSAAEIRAASDRAIAVEATPARLTARLNALLAETPRNWLAIRAVQDVATERQIPLAPDLITAINAAWATDDSWAASAQSCLNCAIDPSQCELSATLICQAPMALTPAGDIAGIAIEGKHALMGEPVDELTLGLSAVGLGATALTLTSGGSSLTLKAGATVAKLAHRMHLLTPRLTRLALDALKDGIDWGGLAAVRGTDDLTHLMRPRILAPVVEIAQDAGRIEEALGPTATLHMLRYIDDAPEARRIAEASEALGAKTVGRIEVLGKSRFLRLTLKFSHHALALLGALFGIITSLGTMLAHAAHVHLTRRLRRLAKGQISRT